jgi:predicted nucleic acid-binding protein
MSSLDTLSPDMVLQNMKNEINKRLKAKGVEVDNEKLEKIAKEFC